MKPARTASGSGDIDVEPREARRRGERAARQHGHELTLGVEVREQAAEVALVGAVAVEQQQDALGRAAFDHVRHQRHRVIS